MLNRDEIKDFFNLQNSHAKKELGQNFLCNQKAIDQIVELCELKQDDNLLEVGPGLGALTNDLIGKTNKYTVVEYDAKFVDFLEKSYSDKNINIVKSNILKFKDFSFNKIVSNLPYYITSDILLYVALNYTDLEFGIFMMQKEAYKRIIAKQGSEDYGVLNIVLSYVFDMKQKLSVSKTSYFPMPEVDSVVCKFTRKQIDNKKVKPLLTTCRACFLNRRKTLFNNLSSIIKDKNCTKSIISDLGYSEKCRAEELSLNDFLKLTDILLNLKLIKE